MPVTTEQQIAEWGALAPIIRSIANGCGSQRAHEQLCDASKAIPALISDLREARSMIVALAPDALHEAEERKKILKDSDELWRGRMQDSEKALKEELTKKQKYVLELEAKLAEAEKGAKRWREYEAAVKATDKGGMRVVIECSKPGGPIRAISRYLPYQDYLNAGMRCETWIPTIVREMTAAIDAAMAAQENQK